jgi:hypothetical protein
MEGEYLLGSMQFFKVPLDHIKDNPPLIYNYLLQPLNRQLIDPLDHN